MDIKSLILNQLPEGAIGELAQKAGVGEDVVNKIMDSGADEIVKNGQKTEGSLFDNLETNVLSSAIATKSGLDKDVVSKVLGVALPFIKNYVDADELTKIIGGLSDGFGMDDIQNITGAIMDNGDEKEIKNKKSGGILGGIFGGLFGKK